MNLLSQVPWRVFAGDLLDRGTGTIPAPGVADLLSRQGLLSEVLDPDDLSKLGDGPAGDLELSGLLSVCHLAVIEAGPFPDALPDTEPLGEADTWMEAHDLADGRLLMMPGDGEPSRNLSFWHHRFTDGQLGVVSFVIDAAGKITGAVLRRSKACRESYDRTNACAGVAGGCECQLYERDLPNGVSRQRCLCRRP